jgi:hypothetical protein
VSVADDQLHSAQPAVAQTAQERGPEDLVFAVTHVHAEDLPVPIGGDTGGDHDRPGHDPTLHPSLDVGRVEEHVGEGGVVQRPVAERRDLLIKLGADARHRRLRHARVDAERDDEIVDLPGRGAVHVGLHHHRPQGLIDAAARLEQAREERALHQLRDRELHITGLGRQQPGTRPVALVRARLRALMRGCADVAGDLRLDQRLQAELHDLTEHVHSVAGLQRLEQARQGRIIKGHRVLSSSSSLVGTR